MKLHSLLALTLTLIGLESAQAQFIDLELPQPEAVSAHGVYRCTADPVGRKGGAVISISESKLWLLEGADDSIGMPMKISDIQVARCPHTYSFKIDLMGEEGKGSLAGCGGGEIKFSLTSPDDSVMELSCIYNK
ncbi:MAG: hypothetical protein IPJ84_18255 [Bdellovibrionales bacterium]|nr:hypothetical protein [Bdellovibrionales bacterium]